MTAVTFLNKFQKAHILPTILSLAVLRMSSQATTAASLLPYLEVGLQHGDPLWVSV